MGKLKILETTLQGSAFRVHGIGMEDDMTNRKMKLKLGCGKYT